MDFYRRAAGPGSVYNRLGIILTGSGAINGQPRCSSSPLHAEPRADVLALICASTRMECGADLQIVLAHAVPNSQFSFDQHSLRLWWYAAHREFLIVGKRI